MKKILIVLVVFFLTVLVLIVDPKLPKSAQISDSDLIFQPQQVPKAPVKKVNMSDIDAIRQKEIDDFYESVRNKRKHSKVRQAKSIEEPAYNNYPAENYYQKDEEEGISPAQEQVYNRVPKLAQDNERRPEFQDETIAWNKWHADIATESLRRLNLAKIDDNVQLGTIIAYSFMVDNKGNISAISIDMVIPVSEYEYIAKNFVPVLKTMNNSPVLRFPKGTNRTKNKFEGIIINSPFGRTVADPSEFNDYENIQKLIN